MINILLIDDERYVIDWLEDVILRHFSDKYEIEVSKTSKASIAKLMIRSSIFDLIISDIQMPGMSGLELLRSTRSYNKQAKIIFLSAHSEFNYVYTAMHELVADYVLKSEEDEVILEHIAKALTSMQEERSRKQAGLRYQSLLAVYRSQEVLGKAVESYASAHFDNAQLSKDLQLLNEQAVYFFLGHIFSETNADLKIFEAINELRLSILTANLNTEVIHTFNFGKNCFCLFFQMPQDEVLKVEDPTLYFVDILEKAQQDLVLQLKLLVDLLFVSETFSVEGCLNFIVKTYGHISKLFNVEAARVKVIDKKELQQFFGDILFWQKAFDSTQSAFSSFTNAVDTMGVSAKLVDTKGKILKSMSFEEEERFYISQIERLNSIADAFRERNRSLLLKAFSQLKEEAYLLQDRGYFISRLLYERISINFFRIMLDSVLKLSLEAQRQAILKRMNKLRERDSYHNYPMALNDFAETLERLFVALEEEHALNPSVIVQQVKLFVQDNLNKDLSLSVIAKHLSYNPSYLSRAFSKGQGEKLSEFINYSRMKEAARLLSESSKSIAVVAKCVGILSPQYFSVLFKRYHGISPNVYRKTPID